MTVHAGRLVRVGLIVVLSGIGLHLAWANGRVPQINEKANAAKQAIDDQAKASKDAAQKKANEEKAGATPDQQKVIERNLAITKKSIDNARLRAIKRIEAIKLNLIRTSGGLTASQFADALQQIDNALAQELNNLKAIFSPGEVAGTPGGRLKTIVVTVEEITFHRKAGAVTHVSVKVSVETSAPPITDLRGNLTIKYIRGRREIVTQDSDVLKVQQADATRTTYVVRSEKMPVNQGPFPDGTDGVTIRAEATARATNALGETDQDIRQADAKFKP